MNNTKPVSNTLYGVIAINEVVERPKIFVNCVQIRMNYFKRPPLLTVLLQFFAMIQKFFLFN